MTPKILRLADVARTVGLCKSSIHRLYRIDKFPRPIQLGPNAIGWKVADIDAWLDSRPRVESGSNAKAKTGVEA